ncbi:hypothetical protein BU15DRAFT_47312 [Melanogaster broomeanus]|nr:hypothetical protein BU15DRAFT_47312 [Melanogaster broomeanus]
MLIIDDDMGKPSLKRRSIEIDGMEDGTESLSPPRTRKRRKQQVYVLVPPPPPAVKQTIERMKMRERRRAGEKVSGSAEEEDEEEFRYNHLERVVVEESKTRLREKRCRWLNCEAILNCANNLLAHLKQHADEDDSQVPLLCHWAGCRRKFRSSEERAIHLERHTIFPLACPFAGCNDEFGQPIEVMQHEVQHQNDHHPRSLVHKSGAQPFVPSLPKRLGQPPHRLPSHRVLPRRVLKSRISADRHAIVGPWVLWNIFSPVDLGMRKQNAPMRGRPPRQGDYETKDPDERHDDYDFLLPLSSHFAKMPPLDDLNSDLVTQYASRGLTFWGPEPPLNSATESPPVAEPTNNESAPLSMDTATSDSDTAGGNATLMKAERDTAAIRDVVASPSRETAIGDPLSRNDSGTIGVTGEEEAVERMLDL